MAIYYQNPRRGAPHPEEGAPDKTLRQFLVCSLLLHLCVAAFFILRGEKPVPNEMTVEIGAMASPPASQPATSQPAAPPNPQPAVAAPVPVPTPMPRPAARPAPFRFSNNYTDSSSTSQGYSNGNSARSGRSYSPVPFPEQQRRITTSAVPYSTYSSSSR